MTVRCSSTPAAISGVLIAGDAVLNLSPQPLNCVAGTRYVHAKGDGLTVTDVPGALIWRPRLAGSLSSLPDADVTRIVVVSDEDDPQADDVLAAMDDAGIPHLHCTLASACEADAFMDDEDAEAVAERLRQLGYL